MDLNLLTELKNTSPSAYGVLIIAFVLCTLAQQGCLSRLSSRQSFCLLMTAISLIGIKSFLL